MRGALFIAVGLALAAPASAFGATVSLVVENGVGTLRYTAAPGEVNDLQIHTSGRTMTISDTGAVVDASTSADCDQISVQEVECSPVDRASFFLDDLDDEAAVTGAGADLTVDGWSGNDHLSLCADCPGTLLGGPGDDTLVAGGLGSSLYGNTGDDTLIGGAGGDAMIGGTGSDMISGRGGADRISPDSGNDVVHGGSGRDHVLLNAAPGSLTVDLRAGTLSGWGTKTLARIEDITGSRFADTLRGNASRNGLSGGKGEDVIVGRAGNDLLVGGADHDRMFGKGGADTFRARDGRRDLASGGPSRDRAQVDSRDVLRSIAAFF
jgi:Ca2+-binding RTX toxin-like protein